MTEARVWRVARGALRDGDGVVRPYQLARGVMHDAVAQVRVEQVGRAALRDADAPVHALQVHRSVLRTARSSPYPNFPVRLFRPPSLSVRLEAGAQTGGVAPSGDAAVEAMTAGARWAMTFGETPFWRRDEVLAWRMFTAAADQAGMNVIVPVWDRRYQPFASSGYEGATTFGQVVWRDTQTWEAEQVQASVAATTEAQATELPIVFAGGELTGGEHFSNYGPRYGWRLYRVVRVISDEAGVKTVEIRPPLREWVKAGTALNFDSPRSTMHCEGDISEVVELLRLGRGTATFVESFNRYP
jgi:hypothetical protein